MINLGIHHKNYIGCSQLNKELFEFESKKDYINYLKTMTLII